MKHDSIKVIMEDCVLIENRIYFFSRDWNALYTTDLDSNRITFLGIMPEENVLARRLCAGIIYNRNREELILIPMTAKKIWIYDLKTAQWKGLERKYMTDGDFHKEIFRAAEYKNNLFLIGSNYPAIIRMNIDTYELDYLTEPYTFLKPLKNGIEGYFRSDFCLKENQLLLASCLNNYVLKIDLNTFDFEWHEVGEYGFCYSGIAWDGEYYWLSPRTGTPIVKWDGKDKTEYFPLPEEFDSLIYNFLGVQYVDGKLIFPGMLQNKTLMIDTNTRKQKIEIYEGQYFFYRYSERQGILSQNVDGLFQWKYPEQNDSLNLYCEIQLEKLISDLSNENNRVFYPIRENEIQIEVSPVSLPLYKALLKRERKIRDKKSKDGVNIWGVIQS